ncbi:MAG: type II secretion system protein [Desulfobacterales bacterium]|nr:type II secretion system protein [Desulfobacterales bacterium]
MPIDILHFKENKGFTLIELIVVIFLISIMLFFSIPRFEITIFSDDYKKASRWIIGKVHDLKDRAVGEQKTYILHINIDKSMFWVSYESMSEEEQQKAEQKAYRLPEEIKVLDVEYPDHIKISMGTADIYFYKKGYCDKAIIHLENDQKQISFLIEPFLYEVNIEEKYVELED